MVVVALPQVSGNPHRVARCCGAIRFLDQPAYHPIWRVAYWQVPGNGVGGGLGELTTLTLIVHGDCRWFVGPRMLIFG